MQINFASRELNLKLVYYGPGRSGKTTNLEMVHQKAPKSAVGEMTSIATESDRTLFFDFLPLNLGKVSGMDTRFQLYTVPGQSYYSGTRKLVLAGCDGIVWVADSQLSQMDANHESLQDLEDNLKENGFDINTIPLVLQWNKRDMENIATVEQMNGAFNRWGAPNVAAVAFKGDGVFPTLKALAALVIKRANEEFGPPTPAAPATTPNAPATPTVASTPVPPVAPVRVLQKPATPAPTPPPTAAPDTVSGMPTLTSGARPAIPAPTPPPMQVTSTAIPVHAQAAPPATPIVPPVPAATPAAASPAAPTATPPATPPTPARVPPAPVARTPQQPPIPSASPPTTPPNETTPATDAPLPTVVSVPVKRKMRRAKFDF